MNIQTAQTLRTPAPLIDEAMVKNVVETFYDRIRSHPSLGPVMEAAIGDHWPEYISKMRAYWTSVLLGSSRYLGNSTLVQRYHEAIDSEHFDQWLELWRETVHDQCPPSAAPDFIRKAEEIGKSLKFNLYESPKLPAKNNNPLLADNAVHRRSKSHSDSEMQPVPLTAPASDIHPRVFAFVFGAYAWMLLSLWTALKSDAEAVFVVAISTFFLAMYAGIPFALSSLGRKYSNGDDNKAPSDFAAFLDRKISTYTGTVTGREAFLQITIIPILLALGITAIGFIIVHAQS